MNTLIHADIFFFITSIAVVIFAIGTIIVFYYIVRLMKDVKYIAEKIRLESDHVTEDIAAIRERIRNGESKALSIMARMFTFFIGKSLNKKRRPKSRDEDVGE